MHQAAQSREREPTHIRFVSPKWKVPFYHDMVSGEDVWVVPEGGEQNLLDALEPRIADGVWVKRRYGIMEEEYWYSARFGRVQRAAPY